MASEGPDIFSQLRQMGGGFSGQQQQSGGDSGVNSKSTVEGAVDNAGEGVLNAAKLTGLPLNLKDLGQISITKPIDSEGVGDKKIPGLLTDAPGGVIAKLLADIFVKNREITDHTQHVGGGAAVEAAAPSSGPEIASLVSPSSFPDYPSMHVDDGNLGKLSPPIVGGQSQDVGRTV